MTKIQTVTIASGRIPLKPHKKGTLKLKLSSAAKKVLKAHRPLKVTLTITTSAKGLATRTVTKTVTLHG